MALALALTVRAETAGAQQPRPPAPPTRPDRKTTSTESAAVERRLTDAVRRAPDSFDVSPSLAIVGANQGLMSPYKPATWDSIPADMKPATTAETSANFRIIHSSLG